MKMIFELIFEFAFEILFHVVAGWLGYHFVKTVTFGKVELEWGSGSESILAEVIGVLFLISIVAVIVWVV